MSEITVKIQKLGHQGDGLAFHNDQKLIVPFGLPDEQVTLDADAVNDNRQVITAWKTKSADRIAPVCPAFTQCGGCSLQHMSPDLYSRFKQQALKETLEMKKIMVEPDALQSTPYKGRRRTTLSLYKKAGVFVCGYKQRSSMKIINITQCSVLDETLERFLPSVPVLFEKIIPADVQGKVHLTLTDQGIDMMVTGLPELKEKNAGVFLDSLRQHKALTRVTWGKTVLYQNQSVTVTFSDYQVAFPAGGFLQPSKSGEMALVNAVISIFDKLELNPKKTKIAELFSGLGTFSFPLASKGFTVTAFEGEKDSTDAVKKASQGYGMTKNLQSFQRDLYKDPLTLLELNKFDAIVLDPPRTGAEDQIKHIAKSKIKTVVMVTCNPATFVRDAEILIKAGFELKQVTPVDQFVWSHHLEGVTLFQRK